MEGIAATELIPYSPGKYTIENPNCMNRIVQWFRDDETSTVLKVGVLVVAALALIGAGFLAGQPLVSLLGALPLALWAWREWGVLDENIEEEAQRGPMTAEKAWMRVENSNATTFQKMQAAIGGKTAYNELPVLELEPHRRDYIDWLQPEDLAFPMMKGEHFDRPFIAIKVRLANPKHPAEAESVITFFQRYCSHVNLWSYSTTKNVSRCFASPLEQEDRAIIHQIVVQKNHPRYTLAE